MVIIRCMCLAFSAPLCFSLDSLRVSSQLSANHMNNKQYQAMHIAVNCTVLSSS